MSKFKVCAVSVSSSSALNSVAIGDTVTLQKKAVNDQFDPLGVNVIVNGNNVGNLATTANTLPASCINGHELNQKMKTDTVTGIVTGKQSMTMSNGQSKPTLIIEVNLGGDNSTANANNQVFILRVKGTISQFPNKVKVLADYNAGKAPTVKLVITGDDILAKYQDINAGVVDSRVYQDTSNYDDTFNFLSSIGGEIEAKVILGTSQNYTVEFKADANEVKKNINKDVVESLKDLKSRVVSEGLISEEELEERLDYMQLYRLSNGLVKYVLESLRKLTPEEEAMIKKPRTLYIDTPDGKLLKKCLSSMKNLFNLRFVGDKGAGKNSLADTISWLCKRPPMTYPTNPHGDKYDIMGAKGIESETTDDGKVKMTTIFQKEMLVTAMENGYMLIMDEVNMLDPGVLAILHGPTDYRRTIDVPSYGHVKAHENFCIIATMNVEYQGTVELNDAFNDRLIPVRFDNITEISHVLKATVPGALDEDIQIANNMFISILDRVKNKKDLDSKCITIRGYIQALNLAEDIGLKEALTSCIADKIDDDLLRSKVINIIDTFI